MHCQSLKEPAVWRMGLWCSVLLVCLFLLPNLSVHPVTWVRPLLDVPGIVHCLHVAVGTVYWWLNAPLGLWQIIGDAVGADESVRLRVHTHTHTHASNKYMRMCISLFTSTSLPPPTLSHTHPQYTLVSRDPVLPKKSYSQYGGSSMSLSWSSN